MKKLIVVMGTSGVGKTTYCNRLIEQHGYPCVRFDNHYTYDTDKFDFRPLFEEKEKADIVLLDGFVACIDPKFERLQQMFDRIELVFLHMDIDDLHEVQKAKQAQKEYSWYRAELLHPDETLNYDANVININSFYKGFKRIAPYATEFKIFIHFPKLNEECRFAEVASPIDADVPLLFKNIRISILKYLDKVSGQPTYQDVLYDGKIIRKSDSLSTATWEAIGSTGIEFFGRSVADLGCFNGFFAIKVSELGAAYVDAFDENGAAVRIAKVMTHINDCSNVKVKQKIVGEQNFYGARYYDIIMALNMLHHVKNMKGEAMYETAVYDMFRRTNEAVICEINDKELEYMKISAESFGFKETHRVPKHMLTAYGWRYITVYRKV